MATAKRVIQIDVVTSAQARRAVQDLNKRLRSIESSSERAAKSLKRMGGNINFMALAAKGWAAVRFAQNVATLSDEMVLLQARIKIVVDETADMTKIMDELYDVSSRTRSSIVATGNLYQRLALATKGTGVSHQELLDVTESLSGALLLSGNSAQESKALLIQLSQAMAKGKLDGDEFRSAMENGAVAMDLLARSMGVTRGELFELSKAGKITNKEMIKAWAGGLGEVRDNLEELPVTFGAVFTELNNQTRRFISLFEEDIGSMLKWYVDSWKEAGDAIERERLTNVAESPEEAIILNRIQEVQKALDYEGVGGFFEGITTSTEHLETQLVNLRKRLREVRREIVDEGRESDFQSKLKLQLEPVVAPASVDPKVAAKLAKEAARAQKAIADEIANLTEQARTADEVLFDYIERLEYLETQGLDVETSMRLQSAALEEYDSKLEALGNKTEEVAKKTKTWGESMQDALAQSFVDGVGDMTDALVDFAITGKASFSDLASSILADLSKMILKMVAVQALKTSLGGTSLGGFLFPQLATGTPYVPRDGLAYLHKGERVVPAAQNTTNNYSSTTEKPISIVNVTDPSQVAEVMSGGIGENIIINTIQRNPDLVRQVLA